MIEVKELGLRERKRAATRRLIERSAITLAMEHGLENVTVDQISDAADVSPRTFFNYFPSKEAAVIGHSPELPDEQTVREFVEADPSEPILTGIQHMLSYAIDEKRGDMAEIHEVQKLRRDLMIRYPHLFALRMSTMESLERAVVDIIARRLTRTVPELAALGADKVRERAMLLAYVSFAGMRHAWVCWAQMGGAGEFGTCIRNSFGQLHELAGSSL